MHLGHNGARQFPNASLTVSRAYRPIFRFLIEGRLVFNKVNKKVFATLSKEVYGETRIRISRDLEKKINASILFVELYSRGEGDWDFTMMKLGELGEEEKERLEIHWYSNECFFYWECCCDGCFSNSLIEILDKY